MSGFTRNQGSDGLTRYERPCEEFKELPQVGFTLGKDPYTLEAKDLVAGYYIEYVFPSFERT